jgi:hypothetical protein
LVDDESAGVTCVTRNAHRVGINILAVNVSCLKCERHAGVIETRRKWGIEIDGKFDVDIRAKV